MARRNSIDIRLILDRYGERAVEAARQALRENADTLAAEAKRLCPVEKDEYNGRHYKLKHPGRLRDSIHVEAHGKNTVLVVADAKDDKGYCYAPIVEYAPWGTPFLKPAYEAKKAEMINHMESSIMAAIGS